MEFYWESGAMGKGVYMSVRLEVRWGKEFSSQKSMDNAYN